jgi:hypothetical protein
MSKAAPAKTAMTRALNRLLQALAEAGAGAAPSDL